MGAHNRQLKQTQRHLKNATRRHRGPGALAVVGTILGTIILNLVLLGLGVAVVVLVLQALGVL